MTNTDADQGRPRYKLPPNFPKQRYLFGINEALDGTDGQPLIVVEGVFGALHCVQNGFPATAATVGSSLGDEQASLIVSTGRPVVLMFDGDESGQAGTESAARLGTVDEHRRRNFAVAKCLFGLVHHDHLPGG